MKGARLNDKKCLIVLIPPYVEEIVSLLSETIQKKFGWHIESEKGKDPAFAYSASRRQYSAEALLSDIVKTYTKKYFRVLGFTDVDLFVPDLNFVFGLAEMGGRGAIVSTHMLSPEIYGAVPDFNLLVARTIKEAIHELGHTLNLRHCKDKRCVMSFSNHIGEVDFKSGDFCDKCRCLVDSALSHY